MTNSEIAAALPIPEWLRSRAVYQINLRTFSAEGDINSLRRELPFLNDLGIKILYLCPIFEEDGSTDKNFWSKRQKASETENPKNPYRMNDYFKIDEEYGTLDDLCALVEEAHALDMKVLLDLVYMHIGPNAPIIKAHPEFVMRDEDGNIKYTEYNFPYINFESDRLREYLWSNMTYFIGEVDVDGFRCDVGDRVPDDFWLEGRRRIKAIKPDAILINEGRRVEKLATSFDACYSYEWHGDILKVISGELSAKQASEREQMRQSNVPEGGYILRDMDNHDTVTDWYLKYGKRVETLAGHDGMELITVMNYAHSGIPMIYCGNELSDESKLSMFANRFHMGAFETTDREKLKKSEVGKHRMQLIKELNRLLSENDAMQSTNLEWLDLGNDGIIAFKKTGKEKSLIFVGNLGGGSAELNLPEAVKTVLMNNLSKLGGQRLTLDSHGYILAEI